MASTKKLNENGFHLAVVIENSGEYTYVLQKNLPGRFDNCCGRLYS